MPLRARREVLWTQETQGCRMWSTSCSERENNAFVNFVFVCPKHLDIRVMRTTGTESEYYQIGSQKSEIGIGSLQTPSF